MKSRDMTPAIIKDFGAHFVPGGTLLHANETAERSNSIDRALLAQLGVNIDSQAKMPDVALYCPNRNRLLLIESVTSHGPIDEKRRAELSRLFANSKADLVFISAFPNRATMALHLSDIAWETDVWVADSPSHLIHFKGERLAGPYAASPK